MRRQERVASLNFEGRVSTAWMLGLSSYAFASSYKWFIVLVFVIPSRIEQLLPEGKKSAVWGAIFGIGAIWAVVGHAICGHLSDRTGDRRPYIFAGTLLTCATLILLYQANSILLLGAGYLLLGFGDDLAMGPYSALLPELVPKEQRGRAGGLVAMAMFLSQVAAVVASLALSGSVAPSLVSIAVINVLAAVWVISVIGSRPKAVVSSRTANGWLEPWRNVEFRRLWFTRFFATLSIYFIIPYAQFFVKDMLPSPALFGIAIKDAEQATGVLALTIAVASAVSAVSVAKSVDRYGRKPVLFAGAFTMVAAFLGMVVLPGFTAFWLIALLLGLGQGAFEAANWTLAADTMPNPASLGRDMGIWQSSMTSVQTFAGAAGMLISFGNSFRHGLGYQTVFVLAALSMLLSVRAGSRIAAAKTARA